MYKRYADLKGWRVEIMDSSVANAWLKEIILG